MSHTITALFLAPGNAPERIEIENNLSAYQAIVDGYIECIDLDDHCTIICNEEAKLRGDLYPNRELGRDVIFGNFLIVGYNDDGDFCSLTQKDIDRYLKKFYNIITIAGTKPSDWDDLRTATCGFSIYMY